MNNEEKFLQWVSNLPTHMQASIKSIYQTQIQNKKEKENENSDE